MERYSLGSAADSGTHSRPAETPSDPNLPDLVGYRKARSLDPHAAGHHFTQSTFGGTTEDGNLRRFRARGTLDAPKPLAAVGRCFGQRNRDERLRITNRKSGIAPHSQKHAQLVSERLGIYLRLRAGLKQHGVGETPHQSRLPWFTSSLVGYRDGRLTFPRSKGTRQPPVPAPLSRGAERGIVKHAGAQEVSVTGSATRTRCRCSTRSRTGCHSRHRSSVSERSWSPARGTRSTWSRSTLVRRKAPQCYTPTRHTRAPARS